MGGHCLTIDKIPSMIERVIKKIEVLQMVQENFYKHFQDIVEYWKPAEDLQEGGIFYNMEPIRHQVGDPGQKCLLMHARQLYNYSAGADQGFQGCKEIAQRLFDSLEDLFPPQNGIYPSIPVKGKWVNRQYRGFISSYNHFYVVTAYARYAAMTGSAENFHRAYRVWKETRNVYYAGPFAEKGIYAWMDDKNQPRGKTGNVQLHHYEALINLYGASSVLNNEEERKKIQEELLENLLESERLFYRFLYDESTKMTPDHLEEDLSFKKEGHLTTLGHPLEWWGFLYEAELLTGRKNSFIRKEGLTLLQRCLEIGLTDSGCFCSHYYFDSEYVPARTDFWTQVEAILTMSYAWHCLKDEKYLNAAKQMWFFYESFMLDKAHGGVFQRVAADGSLLSMQKGDMWKCDHHALRVCERILKYRLLED